METDWNTQNQTEMTNSLKYAWVCVCVWWEKTMTPAKMTKSYIVSWCSVYSCASSYRLNDAGKNEAQKHRPIVCYNIGKATVRCTLWTYASTQQQQQKSIIFTHPTKYEIFDGGLYLPFKRRTMIQLDLPAIIGLTMNFWQIWQSRIIFRYVVRMGTESATYTAIS